MRTKFAFLLLLLPSLTLIAQANRHSIISGTTLSMIPPEGFLPAGNFAGFQNGQVGATIMVAELPSTYSLIAPTFTAESLMTQGMVMLDRKEIEINGGPGTYLTVQQDAGGSIFLKQILMFGDTKHTVLVTGTYPEISKSIAPKIKEALLSTRSNVQQVSNPEETAKFFINTKGTEFKIASFISGTLAYSTDGKIPTDAPSFIVGNSLSKIQTTDLKQYSIDRLKKLPRGDLSTIRETNPISIDGLDGFEIVADGQSKESKPALVYQVMLFTAEGGYYLLIGQANEDFKTNLEVFRKLARTFRIKVKS